MSLSNSKVYCEYMTSLLFCIYCNYPGRLKGIFCIFIETFKLHNNSYCGYQQNLKRWFDLGTAL